MRQRLLMFNTFVLVAFAATAYAGHGDCGQPMTEGPHPTATDALYTLRSAVGSKPCEKAVCDVDGDCRINALDALLTLHSSTLNATPSDCRESCEAPVACGKSAAPQCGGACPDGQVCLLDELGLSGLYAADDSDDGSYGDADDDSDGDRRGDDGDSDADSDGSRDDDSDDDSDGGGDPSLHCLCLPVDGGPASTTTTMSAPTTTSTSTTSTSSTMGEPGATTSTTVQSPTTTTTTTTTTSTTTTTVGVGTAAGQQIYDSVCFACHRAGTYDTDGFAPNLAGKGAKLRLDISSITGQHPDGLVYTQEQIDSLAAFLNGL
jgi:mono/diheme cytochrome c family protein